MDHSRNTSTTSSSCHLKNNDNNNNYHHSQNHDRTSTTTTSIVALLNDNDNHSFSDSSSSCCHDDSITLARTSTTMTTSDNNLHCNHRNDNSRRSQDARNQQEQPLDKRQSCCRRTKSAILCCFNVRVVLMILFLMHSVLTIGCSWLLLYNAGQSSIQVARTRGQHQVVQNVFSSVSQFMAKGHTIINIIKTNLEQGRLNCSRHMDMAQFFYGLKQVFDGSTDLVYYGSEKDEFIMVNSFNQVSVQNETVPNVLFSFNTNDLGQAINVSRRDVSYSVVTRPWYVKTKRVGHITWSDTFMSLGALNQTVSLSIALTYPVYHPINGTLEGIFATQMPLKRISEYMQRSVNQIPSTTAFLMDRNGILIASSLDQDKVLIGQNVTMSEQDGLTRRVVKAIVDAERHRGSQTRMTSNNNEHTPYGDNNRTRSGSLDYNSNTYYYETLNYRDAYGLDWILVVIVEHKTFWSVIFKSSIIVIIVSFASILLGTIAVLVVTQAITQPLYSMQRQLLKLSNFDVDTYEKDRYCGLKSNPFHEIRTIQESIDVLTHTLRSFKHYVPDVVLKNILSERTSSRLGMRPYDSISIMFADIVGFTSQMHSQELSRLLEVVGDYFEEISSIIENDNGLVDKYIGDCIMALWIDRQAHALSVCQAACNCQNKMIELREMWREQGLPELQIRIGINSGNALVGNCGSSRRLNFTALGDSVNCAQRLEALNKEFGTNILIGEETFELVKHAFVCEYVAYVSVRGRNNNPIRVYRPICPREEADQDTIAIEDKLMTACDAFLNYSFSEAIDHYKAVKSLLLSSQRTHQSYFFVDRMISLAESNIDNGVCSPQPLHEIFGE